MEILQLCSKLDTTVLQAKAEMQRRHFTFDEYVKSVATKDAYDYASQVMVDNMLKHDAEEGIQAFIEKRSANWQDK